MFKIKKINFFSKKALLLYVLSSFLLGIYLYYIFAETTITIQNNIKQTVNVKNNQIITIQNKFKQSETTKNNFLINLTNKLAKTLFYYQQLITIRLNNSFIFDYLSGIIFIYVNLQKDIMNEYVLLYGPIFPYAFLIGAVAFAFIFLRKIFDDPILVIIIALNLGFIFAVFLHIVSILWYLPVLALTILFLIFKKYGSI
jgi:hypothetical protein